MNIKVVVHGSNLTTEILDYGRIASLFRKRTNGVFSANITHSSIGCLNLLKNNTTQKFIHSKLFPDNLFLSTDKFRL